MVKRIVYTRLDGRISVINPAPEYVASFETEDEAMADLLIRDVPNDAVDAQIINEIDVPLNREFRNAWRQSTGVFSVDMPQAREIHIEHILAAQNKEVARLKVEERRERLKNNTSKANDHAATIVALEGLDLNIFATQITNAGNPAALSAVWPALIPR